MIYDPIKAAALRLLKAPTEPPETPAGNYGSVQVFRASRRFLACRLILLFGAVLGILLLETIGTGTVLLVPEEFDFEDGNAWPTLLGAGLMVLAILVGTFVRYVAIRIDYDMRYYIVTDRSLRIREGAWTIKEMTLTHANVQNLRVRQGPVDRLFGIWTLVVETAGGGSGGEEGENGHEFRMAGVENAHEIRDVILSHLRRHGKGSGLGDLDDAGETAGGRAVDPRVLDSLRALRDEAAALRLAAGGSGSAGFP